MTQKKTISYSDVKIRIRWVKHLIENLKTIILYFIICAIGAHLYMYIVYVYIIYVYMIDG